jgi:hypothetical protein
MKRAALVCGVIIVAIASTTDVASAAKLPRLYSSSTFRHNQTINLLPDAAGQR